MQKLIVIDTETGGTNADAHSLLSLAAVILEPDGTISGSFHSYVHEEIMCTEAQALEANGLTVEYVKEHGKSPSFVVALFESFLREHGIRRYSTLAGHNAAGFDQAFIKRLYRLAGVKYPFDYHVFDTMSLALAYKYAGILATPNVKLDTLAQVLGVQGRQKEKHDALEDATITAHVLLRLVAMLPNNKPAQESPAPPCS